MKPEVPGEYRVAPARPESERAKDLRAMVVIPSYDESPEKIIDTIFTAVRQGKFRGRKSVDHGIAVMINNGSNPKPSVYLNNLRTYLLLQVLEHKKHRITMRGSKQFNEKANYIQGKNIPIRVIDSFSPLYAHRNSNVGRARRIGTQLALEHTSNDGFIVSTDADTRLGPYLIAALDHMFENEKDVTGVRIPMYIHLEGTTREEKRAGAAADMCWRLSKCVQSQPAYIEDSFVWMAGAGSAFRVGEYKMLLEQGKGYTDEPGHEDTLLGSALADNDGKLYDPEDEYDYISNTTRRRFSERASTGFGQRTLVFDQSKTPFKDIPMDSVAYTEAKDKFFTAVQDIYLKTLIPKYGDDYTADDLELKALFSYHGDLDPEVTEFIENTKEEATQLVAELCKKHDLSPEQTARVVALFKNWTPNRPMSTGHHDFIMETNKVFEEKYPKQSVADFYTIIAGRFNAENADDADTQFVHDLELEFPGLAWSYAKHEQQTLERARELGVNLDDPDILLKAKVCIAGSYKDICQKLRGFFQIEALRVIREAMFRTKTNLLRYADALNATDVPRELILRRFNQTVLEGKINAINDLRSALLYEQSKPVTDALEQEVYRQGAAAAEFYDTQLREISEQFQAQTTKRLEDAKQAIDELEKTGEGADRIDISFEEVEAALKVQKP
jgi:polyhydroxyalkanoate synthesis regulator phasin